MHAASANSLLDRLFRKRLRFEDGSSVAWLNREALRYVDQGGSTMEVMWFFSKGRGRSRVLDRAHVDHWDAPNAALPLTDEKRREIVGKIERYARWRRVALEIR